MIFIQVWPLWFSENGSHLWPFFDEGFIHLTRTPEEIRATVHERIDDPEVAESMFAMFQSCNRATVDDIQEALIAADFHFGKVTLTGASVHVPPRSKRSRSASSRSTAARSSPSSRTRPSKRVLDTIPGRMLRSPGCVC